MTNYLKRLIYIDEAETIKVNPLVWPFLFAITIYGLGFMLFPQFYFVNTSSLFQSLASVHAWLPVIWGVGASLAGASALAMAILRKNFLGTTAAMTGFMVWLFAAFLYLMNGYILVLLTVAVPNIYFWVFYYLQLKWYTRAKSVGLIEDPE